MILPDLKTDPLCVRLMSIPGVGPVTALTFKSAVDDPARFKASRTVAAHFGLISKRYQSGETDNPGHISRTGEADVRSALYVAAHSLLTRNPQWSSLKASPRGRDREGGGRHREQSLLPGI